MTEWSGPRIGRRGFVAGAAAGALFAPALVRAQGSSARVSIGRQPWAAGNSPITQKMMDDGLLEAAGQELGINLTVDWRDYPSALPQVEAFLAGDLDIGMWGNTPIVRLLAQEQPLNVLTVGEGHLRFVLTVPKDSGITRIEDLEGKTVGALVGGDPANALSQMLALELGNADPKAFGITVVNTPTQAQAASVPAGMDAAIAIYPAFLKAQAEIGVKGIMNSFGFTEDGYSGPAGEGAGHELPGVRKSAFYPDGYYLHRSFWICTDAIVGEDAAVGEAFLVASQRAVEALKQASPEAVSELSRKYWELPPELGAKVVGDEVLIQRGWIWPTEGDAAAIRQISDYMVAGKLIPAPLSDAQVKGAFAKAAPILEKAYAATGSVPPEAGFTDPAAHDLRGLPVWKMDAWKTAE